MSEKIKYPDQIRVLKRKGKNISMRFLLSPCDEESGESPLEYPRYSRFVMSILKTEGGINSVTGNIPQEDLPAIVLRTEAAVMHIINHQMGLASNTSVKETVAEEGSRVPKEAYEVTFGFPADIKGKSLAQVIQEGNWEKVLGQKDILKSNVNKFPGNKKIIDAIEKVETLLNMGELLFDDFKSSSKEAAPKPQVNGFPVYETDMKFFSKKREDGKNGVYKIDVKCVPGNKYPFIVQITNAYGDVITTATGGKNITNVTDRNAIDIYLTEAEWVNMVKRMEELANVFEMLHGKERFALMKKHSYNGNEK